VAYNVGMPKFALFFSFTPPTITEMIGSPDNRLGDAVGRAVLAAGGHVTAYYWMQGRLDALAIIDVPSAMQANAVSLALAASGYYSHGETHELVDTPDIVALLQAAKRVQAG
jgi:uncharacterized protein with GYD domain